MTKQAMRLGLLANRITRMTSVCCWVFVALLLANAATATARGIPPLPLLKDKTYELPKSGVNYPRASGGWINTEVVGVRLFVKFYDEEKKPIAANVTKGFAVFKYAAHRPVRAPLNRDGNALATPAVLRPPYNFLLILNLFSDDGSDAKESYTFRYP